MNTAMMSSLPSIDEKYSSRKELYARLLGILLSAVEFWVIFNYMDLHYATNDDAGILRHFMGYYTDQVSDFHVYLHPVLCIMLNGLRKLNYAIPWFSWFQIGLLFVACASASGSLCVILNRSGKSLSVSLLLSTAYLWVYTMIPCTLVTYTQTVAMLGMAAVLRFASADRKSASVIRGAVSTCILMILGIMLRSTDAIPSCLILAACWVYDVAAWPAMRKILLCCFCGVVVCALAFLAWKQLQPKSEEAKDYSIWHDARVQIMDYTNLADVPESVFEASSLSKDEVIMLKRWSYLDAELNADGLTTLAHNIEDHTSLTFLAKLQNAWRLVENTWNEDAGIHIPSMLTGFLLLSECVCLLFQSEKRQKVYSLLPLCTLFLCVGILFGLAYLGRIPTRAAQTVLLTAGGLGIAMLCLLDQKCTLILTIAVLMCCLFKEGNSYRFC